MFYVFLVYTESHKTHMEFFFHAPVFVIEAAEQSNICTVFVLQAKKHVCTDHTVFIKKTQRAQ